MNNSESGCSREKSSLLLRIMQADAADGQTNEHLIARALSTPQLFSVAIQFAICRQVGIDINNVTEQIRSGTSLREAIACEGPIGEGISSIGLRGPWLGHNGQILYAVPATLRQPQNRESELFRLDPLAEALPGWNAPLPGMKPLSCKDRYRRNKVQDFVTESGMKRYLEGGVPRQEEILRLHGKEFMKNPWPAARKVGASIGLTEAAVVHRSELYLYVEITGQKLIIDTVSAVNTTITFNIEGRHAVLETVKMCEPIFSGNTFEAADRRMLVLTTPALLNGWRPNGLKLIAAAISDCDVVPGAEPNQVFHAPGLFAVPAGSVFFLRAGRNTTNRQVQSLGLERDAVNGWGSVLEGTWNYA
ncbi:type III-B CRISPR module-associated Cmr3 family protein [Nitratireductor sp. XY-223]|uniref:type III-B CRISPR module-associated Cmr3 family protein n=1 Tax=Hyphomicrobiales TaxID=356 RepID=UPI0010AA014F|nr:type III-B CRISPR module-associated Cmr3 family protein [Nitratireductor sp. XY-223]